MEQQKLPGQIALTAAQTGQAQAETAAIPKRLELMQKEGEANLALRDFLAKSESSYRMGMLGVRQTDEQRKALKDQADVARDLMRTNIEGQLADARKQGIQGTLDFHNKALAQQKDLMEQGLTLREEANQLRQQGNEIAAEGKENQADQVINAAGLWRTAAGALGLLPEVRTPGAATPATPKAATPAAAKGNISVTDPRGVTHIFPDQASADAFKKAAGIK